MATETTVILAEKRTQALAYAEALTGRPVSGPGPFRTPLGTIVMAQGHLRRFEEPRDRGLTDWSDPRWPDLTLAPSLVPRDRRAADILRQIAGELARAERIIVATDPDREGDAIAWNILSVLRKVPARIDRMLCGDLNLAPIRRAFDRLQPASQTRPRAAAASARARIDQIAGINLTVAVSTALRPPEMRGVVWPVGRVKTPTLWLVVRREVAIRDFRPVDHFVIEASFAPPGQRPDDPVILVHRPDPYLSDAGVAAQLAAAARGAGGNLVVERNAEHVPPPQPFDKPSLLQAAAAVLGWRPDRTADVLQHLYEAGHLTYPRSGCRKLSSADVEAFPLVTAAIARRPNLSAAAAAVAAGPVVRQGRVVDDAAVAQASHTAIIPTAKPLPSTAAAPWCALYDLVARQYLAAFSPDGTDSVTKAHVVLTLLGQARSFTGSARSMLDPGWRTLMRGQDAAREREDGADGSARIPARAVSGATVCVASAVQARRTEPPRRYTLGSLMGDMRKAHRFVADPTLAETMQHKDHPGLGTPATIETIPLELIAKGLISEIPGRGHTAAIAAPDHAIALIETLERAVPDFVRPDLTAELEIALADIAAHSDYRRAESAADALVARYADRVQAWWRTIKSLPALTVAPTDLPGRAAPTRRAGRGRSPAATRSRRPYRKRRAT